MRQRDEEMPPDVYPLFPIFNMQVKKISVWLETTVGTYLLDPEVSTSFLMRLLDFSKFKFENKTRDWSCFQTGA